MPMLSYTGILRMLTPLDVVLRRRFHGAVELLLPLRLTVMRSPAVPLLSPMLLPDLRFLTLSPFSVMPSVLDFCSFVSFLGSVCYAFPIFLIFVFSIFIFLNFDTSFQILTLPFLIAFFSRRWCRLRIIGGRRRRGFSDENILISEKPRVLYR